MLAGLTVAYQRSAGLVVALSGLKVLKSVAAPVTDLAP